MTGRKARWGVLGCAGIAGKRMLPALLEAQNAVLYAIASRSREKLDRFRARFHPVKGYVGYDALLDDPMVDVVYIPLPNTLHCEWVVRACEKGKPVLCEKPLAMNAAEAETILAASRRTGVPVMEAFAYFHGPVMAKIRALLAEGALGRVRYIEGNFSQIMRDPDNVRLKREVGGGVTYDMGCYPVSFARAIAGEEPDEIQTLRTMGEPSGVDVDVLAALRFPSGVKASMYVSFEAHWCTRNTVLCEYGQIDVPSIFDPLDLANKSVALITRDLRAPDAGTVREYPIDCSRNYTLQMEQMGEAALGRAAPAIPLEFSVGNARVMDRLLGLSRAETRESKSGCF
jgi:predicted dehydrogenase